MCSGQLVSCNHHQNWANHREENSAYFSSDQKICKSTQFYSLSVLCSVHCKLLILFVYSGFVEIANIKSYQQNRSKYIVKGKSKGFSFQNAVEKADEFSKNPIVNIFHSPHMLTRGIIFCVLFVCILKAFRSNGHARPMKNRINIKKECDFVVKQEQEQMYLCESVKVTVNQSNRLHKLKNENKRLKDTHQRDQLKWQHEIQELTQTNKEYKYTIRRLTHDNSLLKSRNKQLQSGLNRADYDAIQKNIDVSTSKNVNTKSVLTERTDNNVYEVDKLVSHKTQNGTRHFLIRWKGYDASFDTWEREDSLSCPELLKKYLRSFK